VAAAVVGCLLPWPPSAAERGLEPLGVGRFHAKAPDVGGARTASPPLRISIPRTRELKPGNHFLNLTWSQRSHHCFKPLTGIIGALGHALRPGAARRSGKDDRLAEIRVGNKRVMRSSWAVALLVRR